MEGIARDFERYNVKKADQEILEKLFRIGCIDEPEHFALIFINHAHPGRMNRRLNLDTALQKFNIPYEHDFMYKYLNDRYVFLYSEILSNRDRPKLRVVYVRKR